LFHVQFQLLLLDLHTDFSGGRSGGLVFSSFEEFSIVFSRDEDSLLTLTAKAGMLLMLWSSFV